MRVILLTIIISLFAGCDSSEDQQQLDSGILPTLDGIQWVYQNDERQGRDTEDDSITVSANGEKEIYLNNEFDVLHFDFSGDTQDFRVFTRETEQGLRIVKERVDRFSGNIMYTERFYAYPLKADTSYQFSYPSSVQDSMSLRVRVHLDQLNVPAGSYECWRYQHHELNEWVPIWQECLTPGVGFIELHGLLEIGGDTFWLSSINK